MMLSNVVGASWRDLNTRVRHSHGSRALQIAVALSVVFRVGTEWRSSQYLWGLNGLAGAVRNPHDLLGTVVDAIFRNDVGVRLVLLLSLSAAVGLVVGVATTASTATLLVCTILLHRRQPWILDGGDNVVAVILVFMLTLAPNRRATSPSTRVFAHNVAVFLITAQTILIYITAGFAKASGDRWTHGTALYVISQIDVFSDVSTRALFASPAITTVMTYGVVFYQLWFPVVMFTRARLVWVIIGLTMHIGIGVVMGLLPFSIVMIGLELFILRESDFAALRSWTAGALSYVGAQYASLSASRGPR